MEIKKLTNKVAILYGDDWEALYIDGKLVEEGHSLDTRSILELLFDSSVETKSCYDEDYWEEWGYRAPENWSTVEGFLLDD